MSSQKSQNLKLHLWEPDDNFLRTEFNENFAAIDAVSSGTVEAAARLDAMADCLSRDLYQQTVRNRIYHGLGGTSASLWVNALGSLREVGDNHGWNGVNGVHLGDGNLPTVEGIEASAVCESYIKQDGNASTVFTWQAIVRFTSDGYGTLNTVCMLFYRAVESNREYEYEITLTRLDTNEVVGTAGPFQSDSSYHGYREVEETVNFPLEAGVTYQMEFSVENQRVGPVRSAFSLKNPFTISNKPLTVGPRTIPTTLSASVTPPDWATSAIGLMRWQGSGSAALKVNGKALPVTETRDTVTGTGLSCKETELKLDSLPGGPLSVVLQMNKGSGNLNVYDFGFLWR